MTIHWSGWFTGSATFLAVLVALYQAQAGQRDASQTRRSALRPLVYPLQVKLVFDQNDMSSHTVSRFELVIKNFGMGPALDCTVIYKINGTDIAGEFCLEPQDGGVIGRWASPRRHHILGAGDEMGLSTEPLQYQLGQDDCIEGVLTYHSVFERDGEVSEPFWFIVNSELSSHITTITAHRGKPIQE